MEYKDVEVNIRWQKSFNSFDRYLDPMTLVYQDLGYLVPKHMWFKSYSINKQTQRENGPTEIITSYADGNKH